jgi:L-lactate dehydrogenase complex protein LldG
MTGSREKILATVKQNQPVRIELPLLVNYDQHYQDVMQKYIEVVRAIGASVHVVENFDQIITIIKGTFHTAKRIISTCDELVSIAEVHQPYADPHELYDADLFVTTSALAVAENGGLWITDNQLPQRVLPFITQELAAIIDIKNIVPTMHDAYNIIGDDDYGYAAFIAGPSKTADIEQSLVLGAHGPKTMTVFILVPQNAE